MQAVSIKHLLAAVSVRFEYTILVVKAYSTLCTLLLQFVLSTVQYVVSDQARLPFGQTCIIAACFWSAVATAAALQRFY